MLIKGAKNLRITTKESSNHLIADAQFSIKVFYWGRIAAQFYQAVLWLLQNGKMKPGREEMQRKKHYFVLSGYVKYIMRLDGESEFEFFVGFVKSVSIKFSVLELRIFFMKE